MSTTNIPQLVQFSEFLNELMQTEEGRDDIEIVKDDCMLTVAMNPIGRDWLMHLLMASVTQKSSDLGEANFYSIITDLPLMEGVHAMLLVAIAACENGDPWKSCYDEALIDYVSLKQAFQTVLRMSKEEAQYQNN